MMMMTETRPIKILCVDDNHMVTEGLAVQLKHVLDIRLVGSAGSADEMLLKLAEDCPDVILLDYDMPGLPALEAIAKVQESCTQARVLMFSGHVHRNLISQAIDAGAWGYVAKFDSQQELYDAIRRVAEGEIAFSRSARAAN